ncbi:hypothetical protein [Alteripontixanthobacter maritimus]|uniref:hypothetical protein n=1 Tax=Alteripontixanthobacter maritimus TaxID=2161824 RepID=UPI0011C05FDB|nr:hypothetical protein [Alteripontixanthobacter maritimus]
MPAAAALMMAACNAEPETASPPPDPDPATQAALNDQLMVDPDLVNQNEGNAALTGGASQALPAITFAADAQARARRKASELAKSSATLELPDDRFVKINMRPLGAMPVAGQRLASVMGDGSCDAPLSYAHQWSVELPDTLPIYPMAAVIEAAGGNGERCKARIVRAVAPVPREDVLAFYSMLLGNAGYARKFGNTDGEYRIVATKEGRTLIVAATDASDGTSQLDYLVIDR